VSATFHIPNSSITPSKKLSTAPEFLPIYGIPEDVLSGLYGKEKV